jgi:predicted SnoaL-like aldol condensation-catalyzing enzyme
MIRIAWRWLAVGLLVSSAPIPAAADAALDANKKAVVEFYEAAINRKDFEAASKFFGPRYVQHNPNAPDGIEGFKAFLGFLREKFPESRSEIKRVWAEGDYVCSSAGMF